MITLIKEGGGQGGSCRRRFKIQGNRSQVQACPGATAFEYVWGAIKPMRPLDQWNSYLIQVWARGSTSSVNDKEALKTRSPG